MDNLWRKRVWIPLWIIQILFVGVLLAFMSFSLDVFVDYSDDISEEFGHSVSRAVNAVAAVYIAICGLTIVFDIVEIILFARRKLSPVTAVVLNTITGLLWVILLILLIVSAVRGGTSGLAFIFIIIATGAALGKLIYASVVLHRYRKNRSAARGTYSAPAQTEAGADTAYTAYSSAGAPPNPFRDPSPSQHHFGGSATEYYGNSRPGAYEMQQSGGGRYYS